MFARLLLSLFACAALLPAQSGRSYSADHRWWGAGQGGMLPWEEEFDNPDGRVSIVNKLGAVKTEGHPFFEALGTNGRACVTCHQPANGMSVSVLSLRERWQETQGDDPVFAAIDGSNCPDLPQKERSSHSLLIDRGLFRISLPWPPQAKADFKIEVVRDPTGCNSSAVYGLKSAHPAISVYRRPRVAANLEYVLAGPDGLSFMSDGREPTLRTQATSAILIHEQSKNAPSEEQLRRIVEFESQVFAAQSSDIRAGLLNENGGPAALSPQNLAAGKAGKFAGAAKMFDVWRDGKGSEAELPRVFRASVARGSDLFFSRSFGTMTCAACHNSGTTRWMEIGTANTTPEHAPAELPLFKVTCTDRVIYTQDPGRAMISGKCEDVGAIVLQQLRGLAARAPYFSNGSAGTLREVVDFYDRRYSIQFTEAEKQDLVNFLRVL